jgi:hypothetical protein
MRLSVGEHPVRLSHKTEEIELYIIRVGTDDVVRGMEISRKG